MLEIGCGDGDFTRQLAAAGYVATGVDPEAPAGDQFFRSTLEGFRPRERFDAAVAIRSLHHVHDLDAALERLCAALAPGARLVLYEFAVESFDSDTRAWLAGHNLEGERDWDFEGVIELAELRDALGQRFGMLFEQPTPYHARELGREDLEQAEHLAIVRGELKPAGMRLVYELKSASI